MKNRGGARKRRLNADTKMAKRLVKKRRGAGNGPMKDMNKKTKEKMKRSVGRSRHGHEQTAGEDQARKNFKRKSRRKKLANTGGREVKGKRQASLGQILCQKKKKTEDKWAEKNTTGGLGPAVEREKMEHQKKRGGGRQNETSDSN